MKTKFWNWETTPEGTGSDTNRVRVFHRMETELDALTKEIARSERADRFERELSRATATPLTSIPGTIPDTGEVDKKGRASNACKQAFWDAMQLNHSPAEISNALSEGTDSEGGYLVPDEFE